MSKLNLAVHTATTHSRRTRLIISAAAAIAVAVAAAPASADTLVYVQNGTVYVSQPDGTQARPVTTGNNGWAWPSETDAGIIAVAGGLPRIDGGFDPSGGDQIYEFDQQGAQVAGPVPTQGTYSTVNDPEYVSHFRVAPDNSNVAWTDTSGFASPFTSWRNPNGSGTFSTANDSYGAPLPYSSPEWWGSRQLLITHDGTQFSGNAEYALYNLADGSSPGWANDEAIGSSPSYQVTLSRSGQKWAVMTDDGPDHGGTIQHIAITLETSNTPPNTNVSDTHCSITLPASQFATSHGSALASMSVSSDGSTLAWAQDDGIYEANVSNPSDCTSVTGSVHLVVPGGQMPFLGAAPLAPPAPSSGPGGTGGPGGTTGTGGTGGTGGTSGTSGTGSPSGGGTSSANGAKSGLNTTITSLHVNKHSRQAAVRFHGSGGAGRLSFRCKLDRGRWTSCRSPLIYKHLKKGKHTLQVEAVDRRGHADATPATRRFTV
jgi:hypothetical protein